MVSLRWQCQRMHGYTILVYYIWYISHRRLRRLHHLPVINLHLNVLHRAHGAYTRTYVSFHFIEMHVCIRSICIPFFSLSPKRICIRFYFSFYTKRILFFRLFDVYPAPALLFSDNSPCTWYIITIPFIMIVICYILFLSKRQLFQYRKFTEVGVAYLPLDLNWSDHELCNDSKSIREEARLRNPK